MIRNVLRRLDAIEAKKAPREWRLYRIEELLPDALGRLGRSGELPTWLALVDQRSDQMGLVTGRDPAVAAAIWAEMRKRTGILLEFDDWNL